MKVEKFLDLWNRSSDRCDSKSIWKISKKYQILIDQIINHRPWDGSKMQKKIVKNKLTVNLPFWQVWPKWTSMNWQPLNWRPEVSKIKSNKNVANAYLSRFYVINLLPEWNSFVSVSSSNFCVCANTRFLSISTLMFLFTGSSHFGSCN